MYRIRIWLCLLFSAFADISVAQNSTLDRLPCKSAEDARIAYYGITYDSDLLACLGEVPIVDLPERTILKVFTHVDLDQYESARSLIAQGQDLDPLLSKPAQDALNLYVIFMEKEGFNVFSKSASIRDYTGNELFGSTIGSDGDAALLALLNTPSRFDEFERRIDYYMINHPGEQWPHVAKAQLAVRARKPELAVSVLSFALSMGHTEAELHYWMARALEMQGRFDAAIAAYDRHIEATAMPCQGYISRSVVLGHVNQDEDSITDATRAIATCRDVYAKAQAHQNRANGLRRLRRLNQAIEDYGYVISSGTDRQRLIAKNDMAGLLLDSERDDGTCAGFQDLINDATEVYQISISDLFDNALRNLSVCLSLAPIIEPGAAKLFLDASLFRIMKAPEAQKADLAITALLAFIDLQAGQPSLIYPSIDEYYLKLQSQVADAQRGGYLDLIGLFSVLGGDKSAVARDLLRLSRAQNSIQALALFAVDHSYKSRQDFAYGAKNDPNLVSLRENVMGNDTSRSIYLNFMQRYP